MSHHVARSSAWIGAGRALIAHPAFRRAPLRLMWRSASWLLLCILRRPVAVPLLSGARVRVQPRVLRSGCGAIYVFRDFYEPELAHLSTVLKPGMTFVDGGANLGIYSMHASMLVGESGRVLAFEPAAAAFAQLAENVRRAPYRNVIAHCEALADTSRTAPLYHVNGGPVGYSLGVMDDQEDASSESVTVTTIDAAVAATGDYRVDVLKLDVEGAEELALHGARRTLELWHPVVFFEFLPGTPELSASPSGAWEFLRGYGYRLAGLNAAGVLVPTEKLSVGNNFAVPSGTAAGRVPA